MKAFYALALLIGCAIAYNASLFAADPFQACADADQHEGSPCVASPTRFSQTVYRGTCRPGPKGALACMITSRPHDQVNAQ